MFLITLLSRRRCFDGDLSDSRTNEFKNLLCLIGRLVALIKCTSSSCFSLLYITLKVMFPRLSDIQDFFRFVLAWEVFSLVLVFFVAFTFDRGAFLSTVDTTELRMCAVWSGPSSVRESRDKLLELPVLIGRKAPGARDFPCRECNERLRCENGRIAGMLNFLFGVNFSVGKRNNL